MDRRLAVYEMDPNEPGAGRLFALAPNQASGVGIPAFQFGAALPTVGTTPGQPYYDTTAQSGFVWDGANWLPIAPSGLLTFPTDADLLNANVPPGNYAAALSSGNMYIRTASNDWRQTGIRVYPLVASLLADTPVDGSMGYATDEGSMWVRANGDWVPVGDRQVADLATLAAWTPSTDGVSAVIPSLGIHFTSVGGVWYPKTNWLEAEATILAETNMLTGQIAVATDTGRLFTWDGTAWQGMPVHHYATEVDLLADSPPDGVIAFADDTAVIFTRSAGAWHRPDSVNVSVAATAPGNPTAGDLFYDTGAGTMAIWDGTAWLGINVIPVQTPAPANPVEGQVYWDNDPDDDRLKVRVGNVWKPASPLYITERFGGNGQAAGARTIAVPEHCAEFEISGWAVCHAHGLRLGFGFQDDQGNWMSSNVNHGIYTQMWSDGVDGYFIGHEPSAWSVASYTGFFGYADRPFRFTLKLICPDQAYPNFIFEADGHAAMSSSGVGNEDAQFIRTAAILNTSNAIAAVALNYDQIWDGRVLTKALIDA